MTPHQPHALRHHRVAGVCWLVLVVMVLGTIAASIGGMSSHGIAAITAGLHDAPTRGHIAHDHAHGHAHEDDDDGSAQLSQIDPGDHPHHGADHSHDKAHVPPAAWRSSAPQRSGRFGPVRPWIATVPASRLERPPMG